MKSFVDLWLPNFSSLGASTDAPALRGVLCKFGLHSPYYAYRQEGWKYEGVGWICRVCSRPFRKVILCAGRGSGFWRKMRTWVQVL